MAEEPKKKKPRPRLTVRDRRFCVAYLKLDNLADAVQAAGFKVKRENARKYGWLLMQKPAIKEYYQKLLDAEEKENLIQTKQIIQKLKSVANADMKHFISWKGEVKLRQEGGEIFLQAPEIVVFDSEEVDGTIVQEISYSQKDGFKIKLEPRMPALQMLAKIAGLVVDKTESTVTISEKKPDLSKLTDEELKALAAQQPQSTETE